jgi:hypothetical protein
MSIIDLVLQNSLLGILLRFIVNTIVLFLLIWVVYFRYSRKEEFLFSFSLMGTMIFLIVSLLGTVDVKIGIALGLFALFAIIRFRTMNLSSKDMTYFFTTIGVSIINSQASIPPPILGAIITNSVIILTAYLLEVYLKKRTYSSCMVSYYNLNYLKPEFKKDLLEDLSQHTGQNVERILIKSMDIKKGNAEIEIYYRDKDLD